MSARTKVQVRKARERNNECLECGLSLNDSAATLRIETPGIKAAWLPNGGRCGPCREAFYSNPANGDATLEGATR